MKKIINKKGKFSKTRGFMQIILLAIIIIASLAYFNIDIRTIFDRPEIQKIWNITVMVWSAYIKPLVVYLWTSIGTLPQNVPAIQPAPSATSTIAIPGM